MYYFESEERQQKLLSILESWVGTPYRHKAGVKQLGCDCIHLPIGILTEMGLLKLNKRDIPHYPRDYHQHNSRSILVESIKKHLVVEEIKDNKFMNGDLFASSLAELLLMPVFGLMNIFMKA
jgi:hypothetical protein